MTNKKCGGGCSEGVDQKVIDTLTDLQADLLRATSPCEGVYVGRLDTITVSAGVVDRLVEKEMLQPGLEDGHFFLTDLGAKVRGCFKQDK